MGGSVRETVTGIELSPEGTGYRAKTRFARFYNLPELMSLFKECADIQTADLLDLPVPEAEYVNEVLKPSHEQQEMVKAFAERAEAVRAGALTRQRTTCCGLPMTGGSVRWTSGC